MGTGGCRWRHGPFQSSKIKSQMPKLPISSQHSSQPTGSGLLPLVLPYPDISKPRHFDKNSHIHSHRDESGELQGVCRSGKSKPKKRRPIPKASPSRTSRTIWTGHPVTTWGWYGVGVGGRRSWLKKWRHILCVPLTPVSASQRG